MDSAVVQNSDTNMARGSIPDPRHGWSLVATQKTDSGFGRTMDPDTILGNSPSPDVILFLDSIKDHPDQQAFPESVAPCLRVFIAVKRL